MRATLRGRGLHACRLLACAAWAAGFVFSSGKSEASTYETNPVSGTLTGTQTFAATSGAAQITGAATLSGNVTFNLGFQAEYLLVGAGGGGAIGGGGGGQVLTGSTFLAAGTTGVTVGAGGVGSAGGSAAGSGGNSLLGSITGTGGLGGGSPLSNPGGVSGGGDAGGTGARSGFTTFSGGGGGGAGSAGGNATTSVAGGGGSGLASDLTGSSTTYGGGGGGVLWQTGGSGTSTGANGGSGGGGAGGGTNSTPPVAGNPGAANTGGGGGGGVAADNSDSQGGAGGSGLVVFRYLTGTGQIGTAVNGSQAAGAGSATDYTVVTYSTIGSGGFTLTQADLSNRLAATASADFSGGGGLTFGGPGKLTLTGNNTYTGTTAINAGVVALESANALPTTGAVSFGGGQLQYSAANTTDISSRIVSSTSAISLDTNGQNVTYGSGIAASNVGGLVKAGGGVLTLGGLSQYSGVTQVVGGELSVTGTIINSPVTIGGNALLTGTGSILNSVQVLTGGTVSPGVAGGTGKLTLNTLNLDPGSFAVMQITGTGAGQYDQIFSTGNLDYAGGNLTLEMSGGAYTPGDDFKLFGFTTSSGTLAAIDMVGSTGGWENISSWYAPGATGPGLFAYGEGVWQSSWVTVSGESRKLIFNQVDGTLTVVPEPSTIVMAGAGFAAVAIMRSRWRRRGGEGVTRA